MLGCLAMEASQSRTRPRRGDQASGAREEMSNSGGAPETRITARNHVSSIGTSRSAVLAGGAWLTPLLRNGGKIDQNGGHPEGLARAWRARFQACPNLAQRGRRAFSLRWISLAVPLRPEAALRADVARDPCAPRAAISTTYALESTLGAPPRVRSARAGPRDGGQATRSVTDSGGAGAPPASSRLPGRSPGGRRAWPAPSPRPGQARGCRASCDRSRGR